MTDNILENMKSLGFSAYECKAYLTLLEDYPMNGYALSKASSIPRSRIYEVLKSLVEKQMVAEEISEKATVYTPKDPATVFKGLKHRYEDICEGLSAYAAALYREPKADDRLVAMTGRENIVGFLRDLIRGAKERIAVSIWDEELCELTGEIDAALARGVVLCGIYFGTENRYNTLVTHRRMDRYTAEKKERYMAFIVDRTQLVSGIVSRGEASKVTWTRDEGLIAVSEDYIAHDLMVNLHSAGLDPKNYAEFEAFADRVHDSFFHDSKEQLEAYLNRMLPPV